MCGIAGIWNSALSTDDNVRRVELMLSAMSHRGPDGSRVEGFPGGAMGMNRLALVDLSPRGQQPLWSERHDVAIVFNGEVYNFREERRRLTTRGYSFITSTDTEVILALYLEKGDDFVSSLRGMFALAILDFRVDGPTALPILTLARDPFGIKPLYLAKPTPQVVAFSSELRALLRGGAAEPELSTRGLHQYLTTGYISGPTTVLRDVELVEPGTMLRFEPGQAPTVKRYATVPMYRPKEEDLEAAAERLRCKLDESVRVHAFADAPVGAFLSGGIDSTAIVGMMRPHIQDLRTFTVSLVDHPSYDESMLAEDSARQFGCAHTTVEVPDSELEILFPSFTASLDQPSTDAINTWLISREAARSVKGVLSGLGGDELFAGYSVVGRLVNQSRRRRTNAAIGTIAAAAGRCSPVRSGRVRALAARRTPVALWAQAHRVFPDRVANELLGKRATGAEGNLLRLLQGLQPNWQKETAVGLAFLLDSFSYMGNQLLRDSDTTSMAHGLELRVPFVDAAVVAFSRSCKDAYKWELIHGTPRAKRVLVAATRELLPVRIRSQPKRGFAMPYDQWLARPLQRQLRHACDRATVGRRGILDPDRVDALVSSAQLAKRAYPQLWALLVLEQWCAAVLDSRPSIPLIR